MESIIPAPSLSFAKMETTKFESGMAGGVGKCPRDSDHWSVLQEQQALGAAARAFLSPRFLGPSILHTAHVQPRGGWALGPVRTPLPPWEKRNLED